jgi:hypothetical protein
MTMRVTMAKWARAILVCAALLYPDPSWATQWVALTLAPDGAWGAAATQNLDAAMAGAISDCQERSTRPPGSMTGCGALLRMAPNGWGIAEVCGKDWHVSVERTLADAEFSIRAWKLSMQYERGATLPDCRRVVTVGPDGNVHGLTDAR